MTTALRIVQLSDPHFFAEADQTLLGVKTQQSFQAVLELLQHAEVPPQLILLTGDLSQDETLGSYQTLAAVLDALEIPIYFIPGNHDDSQPLKAGFVGKNILPEKQIILGDWQIILLDSHRANCIEGYLDPAELRYLAECLRAYPDHATLVALHHHPIPMGSHWIDQYGLINAHEFWQVIDAHPQVKTVLFGHVHQCHEEQRNHVLCCAVPSTCVQFKRHSARFAIEKLAPGYRWVDLFQQGGFKTGVVRTAKYIGHFAADARGY